jgi:exopolysaccharide biosynthesis protein
MVDQADTPRPPRRWLRRVLVSVAAVLVIAGSIAAWAINRYVVDHVKISNVSQYEQKQAASSTVAVQQSAAASSTTASTLAAGTSIVPGTTVATTTTTATLVLTDRSFTDGSTTISIEKRTVGTGADSYTYFVADIVVSDARQFRSAFAKDKFGENIIDNTSKIAAEAKALLAINGDYYGFRRSGIVIRNGIIYRDNGARQGLALKLDGTMSLYDEKMTSAQALLDDGAWQTLSFGPGLVDNGQVIEGIENVQIDTNIGNHSIQGQQPRTGLGMIAPNHFVFVVVDGRSRNYSRGVTLPEFAELFKGLGATVAYNLDGGGSATMVFNGQLVNNPLGNGRERGTSDIVYVGALPTG